MARSSWRCRCSGIVWLRWRANKSIYREAFTAKNAKVRDELSHRVIGCAINVHRVLGNALLESAYQGCLEHELSKSGLSVSSQVVQPLVYEGVRIEIAYRLDLIVNNELVIELKTVAQLLPIHDAQMLTYLRLSGIERGLLMNFHAHPLVKGIKRFVLTRHSP